MNNTTNCESEAANMNFEQERMQWRRKETELNQSLSLSLENQSKKEVSELELNNIISKTVINSHS